jgi:hypothetical protein
MFFVYIILAISFIVFGAFGLWALGILLTELFSDLIEKEKKVINARKQWQK